jgi:hypothetical protein
MGGSIHASDNRRNNQLQNSQLQNSQLQQSAVAVPAFTVEHPKDNDKMPDLDNLDKYIKSLRREVYCKK